MYLRVLLSPVFLNMHCRENSRVKVDPYVACHPGDHYCDYCPDALSLNQVPAPLMKIWAPIQYKDDILPVYEIPL